jgi:tRNA G18 (ribose-2'-O)-methylase SpoU
VNSLLRPGGLAHCAAVVHVIEIDDVDDPRLGDFRDLTTADRRPDRPGGRGLVLAEGTVVVRRLLASRYPVRALLGDRRKIDELSAELGAVNVPAYVATAQVMAEVVGFHLNRGVLASADRIPPVSPAALARKAHVLVVLEGVNDHENLGSIFRNAAALGVDGVLLGSACADPLYRRSVRVSMGHVLRVPFGVLSDWPADLQRLRDDGFRLAALTPRADAEPLPSARLHAAGKVALLLGAEGAGLTDAALDAADQLVRIPMAGGVDSLNVATAAAIACYAITNGG